MRGGCEKEGGKERRRRKKIKIRRDGMRQKGDAATEREREREKERLNPRRNREKGVRRGEREGEGRE